jgi:PAS domain S-box-containing protein
MTFNLFQIVTTIALLSNVVLGILVFHTNPSRRANHYFLCTSIAFDFWMACLLVGSWKNRPETVMFWMRSAGVAASLLPFAFDLLRFAISKPHAIRSDIFKEMWVWVILITVVVVTCFHPAFVIGVSFGIDGFAQPQYGAAQWVYTIYWIVALAILSVRCVHDFRRLQGVARTELQFVLLASAVSIIVGVSFAQIIPLLTSYKGWIQFTPLCVVLLDGIIAYGIATKKIMAVPVVLQRSLSYALLVVYLVILYSAVQYTVEKIGALLAVDLANFAYLAAAIVLALSVAPANGWMQKVSTILFVNVNKVDIDQVVQRASHILQSVATTDSLCQEFSELIGESFGTSETYILLSQNDRFVQIYPQVECISQCYNLTKHSAISRILLKHGKPVVKDILTRSRPIGLSSFACDEMKEVAAEVAIGIISKKELGGIVLLKSKLSGRIYDETEQHALQLLCDQLAVALENANLYTEIQNGKIYNDILLDSLTSGIVAVDEAHNVTVFNKRAQSLTGLSEGEVVDAAVDRLPASLARLVERIFQTGSAVRDRDMFIESGDVRIPIRVSGSVFHSYTGETLGALIVFNDMTMLRKMEEQIRRTDRLSSIGTLSAGMAHEIKNPLVTIKTFTELLPIQYGDTEFRQTFFDLVGQEVTRIDAIVNRLLNFARPAKASLKPISLHDVLENSIHLVEQQLVKHRIDLEKDLAAERTLIQGDAEQLNQTFINFFLNATQAMAPGGTLSVKTFVLKSSVQVDVKDTGCGLSEEKRKHIFDPFFTTKEDGVGLGLSVSHGIIQEHKGAIDVESEEGRGTVFHVLFPLIAEKE